MVKTQPLQKHLLRQQRRYFTGTYSSMADGNAKPETKAETQFKVTHARQVVDQVTLLRERVKRQERAIETVIAERDRAMQCCEKQKELIEQLQQKLELREAATGTRAEPERGLHFGQLTTSDTNVRVNSLRGALFRIGGIELPNEKEPEPVVSDVFDASEFQPIAEDQGVVSRVRESLTASVTKAATSIRQRRELSIESDGLQT